MTVAENGNTVSVHYRGTFEDGTEFDSSHNRGEPITFKLGSGQMIPGFDTSIPGMAIGETKDIQLTPEQAYGEHVESQIQEIPRTAFPEDFEFVVGASVQGTQASGQQFLAKIITEAEETVTLDFNHPLAGKTLMFNIELIDIT